MRKVGEKYIFRHSDIKPDKDGWIDAFKYLPEDGELVDMKLMRRTVIPGWITARKWEGLKLKKTDTVLSWKLKDQSELCP